MLLDPDSYDELVEEGVKECAKFFNEIGCYEKFKASLVVEEVAGEVAKDTDQKLDALVKRDVLKRLTRLIEYAISTGISLEEALI